MSKPIAVYESMDPTWKKFSVSMPGFPNTQWFNSRADAEAFIRKHGFSVFVKVPSVRISTAEYSALVAVAKAASATIEQMGASNFPLIQDSIANLNKVIGGAK